MAANARARAYLKIAELRKRNELTKRSLKEVRAEVEELLREEWRSYLERRDVAGKRTVEAILPHFDEWMERSHGVVHFRLTQVLSGHGCFASYLYRIGRLDSPRCLECRELVDDTPEHALQECSRWSVLREELKQKIGDDLALPTMVGAMLSSRDKWEAVSIFTGAVMTTKEEEERLRQGVVRGRSSSPSLLDPGG